MSVPSLKPMSVEEYLRTEETSSFKREYVGGFVYPLHGGSRAQAGTTEAHMEICMNIAFALRPGAKVAGCRLYQSDMKLRVEATDNFYYPDVMAVCDVTRPAGDATFVTGPCLVVEVTSKSTVQNDRRTKHAAYTGIPSVQTYLIVEQAARRVSVYQRAGERWGLSEIVGEGRIALPCLGTELTLAQIYEGLAL